MPLPDGLDKDARLEAERKKQAEEDRRRVRLNTPFPGKVKAPDLDFFTAGRKAR